MLPDHSEGLLEAQWTINGHISPRRPRLSGRSEAENQPVFKAVGAFLASPDALGVIVVTH